MHKLPYQFLLLVFLHSTVMGCRHVTDDYLNRDPPPSSRGDQPSDTGQADDTSTQDDETDTDPGTDSDSDIDAAVRAPGLLGQSWSIDGAAVVKTVAVGPNTLLALCESHVAAVEDEQVSYVLDHPRELYILQPENEPRRVLLDPSPLPDTMITDIAKGPEDDTAWVVQSRFIPPDGLDHTLRLFRNISTAPAVEYSTTSNGTFPDLDVLAGDEITASNYSPRWDTIDVSRIASQANQVGLVARNAKGTLYAERYRESNNKWSPSVQVPLSRPGIVLRIRMTGGSYDVMGQLVNRYKVHAAFQDDGTLLAGSSVLLEELQQAHELFQDDLQLPDESASPRSIWAFVVGIDSVGNRLRPQTVPLGERILFQSLIAPNDQIYISGLVRDYDNDKQGDSHLQLIDLGKWETTIDVKPASGAAQALAYSPYVGLIVGGSWNWEQNPTGLSISGGENFIGVFDQQTNTLIDTFDMPVYAKRSETRSLTIVDETILCAGGMKAGPGTHTADNDLAKVKGDGFVLCVSIPDGR